MIISTTNINKEYEIIDTVFVIHVEEAGGMFGGGGIDSDKGFDTVKGLLSAKASELGADAIIGCDFEHTISKPDSLTVKKNVLTIFAFGTAVKLTQPVVV